MFSPAGDKLLITGGNGVDMLVVKMHLPPVTTRLYAMHDANFNVTGLVTSDGEVAQRYAYDADGTYSILNEDWVQSTLAAGYINWVYLHQGGRLDGFTGLYHFRHRDYDPELGRWIQADPLGYIDGANTYQYETSSPVRYVDRNGLYIKVANPKDRQYFLDLTNTLSGGKSFKLNGDLIVPINGGFCEDSGETFCFQTPSPTGQKSSGRPQINRCLCKAAGSDSRTFKLYKSTKLPLAPQMLGMTYMSLDRTRTDRSITTSQMSTSLKLLLKLPVDTVQMCDRRPVVQTL